MRISPIHGRGLRPDEWCLELNNPSARADPLEALARPAIAVERIGHALEPIIIVDDFMPNAGLIRERASKEVFVKGENYYPGIRAELPASYLHELNSKVPELLGQVISQSDDFNLIDASYSLVTTPPAELTVSQRLPHCDAFKSDRFAMVHYLSEQKGGTAFFRHRATGFETIDEQRAPILFAQLEAEVRLLGAPKPSYVEDGAPLFDRIFAVPARFNRAIFYRSWLLHSGSIEGPDALSSDPAQGRLTVTAFFTLG